MKYLLTASQRSRPITGRFVLLCVIFFFGVIVAVNLTMARFALTTFGGVETRNAYQAGLQFSREISDARAQQARHLKIEATLSKNELGAAMLEIVTKSEKDVPITGAELIVTVVHPADRRQDVVIATSEIRPGLYRGKAKVHPGQRDLIIDVFRGGERIFRSKNRVLFQ